MEDTSEEILDQETSEETSEETSDQDTSEEISDQESSEETSEESSEQIDYTETLIQINDHLDLISNRLDYVGALFWVFISVLVAVIMYRLFAWFWKDL